jgi:clan AA aspartic protease (TIGR02281 family)
MEINHHYAGFTGAQVIESRKKHNAIFKSSVKKWRSKKLFTLSLLIILTTFTAHAQNYFETAAKAWKGDDYATAIQNLNTYLQLYPKHSDSYTLRASCNYHLNEFNEALSDIAQAIKFFDKRKSIFKESWLYSERGDIYRAAENYEEAIKNYSEAIKKDPKTIGYLMNRAECYAILKDYNSSDADYKKALQIDNTTMSANLGLVENMIDRKEYNDAINTLNQLEKIDPRNYSIFYKRSWLYAKQEDYKKAIDDIIQCMYYGEIDEYNSFYLCLYSMHNLDYTVAKVKSKTLTDKDQKYQWKDMLASVYTTNKKYHDAIDVYDEIEKELGSGLRGYYYRGMLYNQIGAYNKAISDYDAGIKENSDLEDLYMQRASAYNAQGKFDDAIRDLNKALQLAPMSDDAYYLRAWTNYMYKKDYQKAIEDISMAITIGDASAHAYLLRAISYQEINKPNLADKDFKKVMELDSSKYKVYALILQGNEREAYPLIDTLIKKDSTDYYAYACMYSLLSNQDKSIDYLKKALNDGWRDFVHIEYDPDLDNIRNSDEFKSLIQEYKDIYQKELLSFETDEQKNDVDNQKIYVIPIKKLRSNIYEVICAINGVPMKFLFDTGASGVLLSRTEADFLLKNDYLKLYDIGEKKKSRLADGSIVESTSVKLRKFKIGDLELENIDASIMDNPDIDLLLGQSVLQKFGKIEIDNERNIMIITVKK